MDGFFLITIVVAWPRPDLFDSKVVYMAVTSLSFPRFLATSFSPSMIWVAFDSILYLICGIAGRLNPPLRLIGSLLMLLYPLLLLKPPLFEAAKPLEHLTTGVIDAL